MVQIRDIDTWRIRPGVKCGDLGTKVGYFSKDNGWATFENVRIPRTDMFMGICEVSREGELSLMGDLRVLYVVMMNIRLYIVQGVGIVMSTQAARNALRYFCVRR